jgi:hypothetical protein
METFVFKFGCNEFICQACCREAAMLKADQFVDTTYPMNDPYGWVKAETGNVFRMSVGA